MGNYRFSYIVYVFTISYMLKALFEMFDLVHYVYFTIFLLVSAVALIKLGSDDTFLFCLLQSILILHLVFMFASQETLVRFVLIIFNLISFMKCIFVIKKYEVYHYNEFEGLSKKELSKKRKELLKEKEMLESKISEIKSKKK